MAHCGRGHTGTGMVWLFICLAFYLNLNLMSGPVKIPNMDLWVVTRLFLFPILSCWANLFPLLLLWPVSLTVLLRTGGQALLVRAARAQARTQHSRKEWVLLGWGMDRRTWLSCLLWGMWDGEQLLEAHTGRREQMLRLRIGWAMSTLLPGRNVLRCSCHPLQRAISKSHRSKQSFSSSSLC